MILPHPIQSLLMSGIIWQIILKELQQVQLLQEAEEPYFGFAAVVDTNGNQQLAIEYMEVMVVLVALEKQFGLDTTI